jgi:hypothetical protein
MSNKKMKQYSLSWISLFLVTFLSAYLFIFNEWLFAVTKPSFLNGLGLPQQLEILLTTSAILTALCLLGLLPLAALGLLPSLRRNKEALIKLGSWLPAVVFATLILMMVDNFTYTIFKWGIVSTDGWSRALYGLCFIVLIVACHRRTLLALVRLSRRKWIRGAAPTWSLALTIGVLVLPGVILMFLSRPQASPLLVNRMQDGSQLPHILLITSDGLSARHLSVYGYERDTTPRMRQLAPTALVAENAFPNSGKTTGSVISMYTGKYPTETRLLLPSDVLKGHDSYEHLPGILRSLGYKTVQITSPYYLDANTLNLAEGFDEVKTRSGVFYSKYIGMISKVLPHDKALFTDEIIKRLADRIRHIFFIQRMVNPYLQVTGMTEPLLDIERLELIKHEMRTSKQPLFIHVHLMVTHGPKYKVMEQMYSAGQAINAQALWTDDFYDDSILEFDRNVGEFIDYLSELDLLDSTVLIIGSDHGQKWDPVQRMPLIIRFPHEEYAGKIQVNVQNLDIAPTILDYIGVDIPAWMHGESLLLDEGLEQRPIYGMTAIDPEDWEWDGNISNVGIQPSASDNQYSNTLVYCDKWFKLDSYFLTWETGFVDGSSAECPPESEITDKQAFLLILEQMEANGYDISELKGLLP